MIVKFLAKSSHMIYILLYYTLLLPIIWTDIYVEAYDVRYTLTSSPNSISAERGGYCSSQSGGHTMMPMKESFQTLAFQAFSAAGFTEAAIGGINTFTSCGNEPCEWIFNAGLMNGTSIANSVFLRGSVLDGVPYTRPVPGMYHNFARGQPVSFSQTEDKVIPKMMANGQWANEVRNYLYSNWVCEYYVFTLEELNTAPATDENGFIIFNESNKFKWWIGLIIALVVVAIIVAVIIIYCSCCKKKEKGEQYEDEEEGENYVSNEESEEESKTANRLGEYSNSSQTGNISYQNSRIKIDEEIDEYSGGANPLERQFPQEGLDYFQEGFDYFQERLDYFQFDAYPQSEGFSPQDNYSQQLGFAPQEGYSLQGR